MSTCAAPTFTAVARTLGIISSVCVVVLVTAYSAVLAAGLLSLGSSHEAIGDPYFSILEMLILTMMPMMVLLMICVHAWTPVAWKPFSLASVIFMGSLAVVTSSVHFVTLSMNSAPDFVAQPLFSLLFTFHWPSIPYALEILGWDVFFALSMLFAAPGFGGGRLVNSIRILMIVSGVLALAGLFGPIVGDMRFRMIGVVGYTLIFPIIALLLGSLFYRFEPTPNLHISDEGICPINK